MQGEQGRPGPQLHPSAEPGGDLLLVDHRLEEAAGTSMQQEELDDVQHPRLAAAGLARPPGQHEGGELDLLLDGEHPLPALERLRVHQGGNIRTAGNAPKAAFHRGEHRGLIEVAHHDEHRVVGPVEIAVVGLDVAQAQALEVLHPSNDRPVVGMGQVHRRLDPLDQKAHRRILHRLPPLLADDRHLGLELLLHQEQVLHPVGFQLERDLQAVGRHALVEDGAVAGGKGVVRHPLLLQDPVEGTLRETRRALEHQVLEDVRDPGEAAAFVARSHPITERQAGGRAQTAGHGEDLQAVVQDRLPHMFGKKQEPSCRKQGAHDRRP